MLFFTKETRYNILLTALAAVVITIPLYNLLNSAAIIFFVVACAIQRTPLALFQKLSRSVLWIFPALYLIWIACSYFWDSSGGFAARDIERYAILLFLPPFVAGIPEIKARHICMACMLFVVVITIVSLICLFKAYHQYQASEDYRVFYYHYLSMQMDLNAIFLSNYCLASIIWLLYYGFIKNTLHKKWKGLVIVNCLFLLALIFMLSSKLMLFLTLVTIPFFIIYAGYIRRRMFWPVLSLVLLTASGVYASKKMGYLNWRLTSTTIKSYSGPDDNQNGVAIRLLMWQSAWELIRERPLLGYGVKGARKAILEKYREKNFTMGYEEGYHSHSQYLESALMGGIPAFLLLMAMLLTALINSVRRRNLLLLLLLFVMMCQSAIGSIFETQQELVFFIFFVFLFAYHHPSPQKSVDE